MKKTSEVYTKLYHYTTWEGLLGILDSQTLWATNYKFLNDYSEIILFREKLIPLIHPLVRNAYEELIRQRPQVEQKIHDSGGIDQVVQHDSKAFVDAQYSALGDEIYILSFCGPHGNPKINRNGLLSQWRGYGTGGGAVLILDTKKIEEILAQEANQYEYSAGLIADLVYSDDEQKLKEELSEELTILSDIVKLYFNPDNTNHQLKIDASKGFLPFVQCISRYKHYGFQEENEVRIVALPTVISKELLKIAEADGAVLKPEKERKFRNQNGKNIPYIELFESKDIILPIEQIIVGPHKDKDQRAAALREKLKDTQIEITCSEIPFAG
jgi:hypothetical protein